MNVSDWSSPHLTPCPQRDEAVLGLSALEDRALLAESSLGNLQHVLEQFQRGINH